jgi:SPP1 family predicted phage head-tail adaptor
MIGLKTSVGARPHRVTFQNPGANVPDGDGGWTSGVVPLDPPALSVSIEAASAAALERVAAGTALSSATHILTGPYHPQVTTQTVVLFNGRTLYVRDVKNHDERNQEMTLLCEELVP